jgi:hypothetical protein
MRNIVDINKTHSVLFKNSLSSCFSLSGYRPKSDRVHPAVQLASVRLTVWNPLMHSSQILRTIAVASGFRSCLCSRLTLRRSRAFLATGRSLRVCRMLDQERRLSLFANNRRHQKRYLTLHVRRLIFERAALVEYSNLSVAVSGAPGLIVEPLSSIRCSPGPHAPGGCKRNR